MSEQPKQQTPLAQETPLAKQEPSVRHSASFDAVVAVPVTAAWVGADASRPVDAPVTQPVPVMAAWMASLTHEFRLDLLGRIATSALLGEPVLVVGEHKGWSEVRLPWQPNATDPRGYPAWIPSAHLAPSSTPVNSSGEPSVFCVTRRLVPARSSRSGPPVQVLSMGTRLGVVDVDPATGTNHAQVLVQSPVGTFWIDADCGAYAPSSALSPVVGVSQVASLAASRADDGGLHSGATGAKDGQVVERSSGLQRESFRGAGLIAAGSELLGLAYLWGGISGWGVDCSGLVHLAHRVQGSVVPRDSVDQHALFGSVRGKPQAGQPVFFRYRTDSLRIHHVGIAVSESLMLHAPKTGRVVEFLPIATEPYGLELETVGVG